MRKETYGALFKKVINLLLIFSKLCRFKLRNLKLRKSESVNIRNSCIKGLIESFSKVTKSLQIDECFFRFIQNRVPRSNLKVSEQLAAPY